MVREVARLVSDSTCSSVLLSDEVLLLSAAATDTGGVRMSKLGVTWNLPTVTEAGWTSDSTQDALGLGELVIISGPLGRI